MSFTIRSFMETDFEVWDRLCYGSLQSTLLHTRSFLSYHEHRFVDKSLMIIEDKKVVGLFPAALDPKDNTHIVSHPGITYGGLIHQGCLRGEKMVTALSEIGRHYANEGIRKLTYKAVPIFYHRAPAQDDLYALFRLGARRIRCDLSSAIDLKNRLTVSERRRRSLRKATQAGVKIIEGKEYFSSLWDVLIENLENKHGVAPTHSLSEIKLLSERFPDDISCICGSYEGNVVAGVVLFVTSTACHAQYIASNTIGYAVSALDLVIEYSISLAAKSGKHWFDFGISNENQGMLLNEGLYKFKCEFGGGGMAHEFYELDLLK